MSKSRPKGLGAAHQALISNHLTLIEQLNIRLFNGLGTSGGSQLPSRTASMSMLGVRSLDDWITCPPAVHGRVLTHAHQTHTYTY